MPGQRCRRPPKTVPVKGHYRELKPRRKKRQSSKPKRPYWYVSDGLGHTCGHQHRTMSGALQCRRRHERAQRAYRARHGKNAGARKVWTLERAG